MTMVILFVLGAIVGSFLNVWVLRLNTGRGVGGRSACPSCRHRLSWYELVPVLSFFFLRGRCAQCRAKISWQYPAVELLTGLLFLSVYSVYGLSPYSCLLLIVFCLYLMIVVYDLRHKIIPDQLVYWSIFLSLLTSYSVLLTPYLVFSNPYTLIDWLAGPIFALFFGLIWLLSQGRAMGLGDAKLVLSIGLLLGFSKGLSALMLAFWIGALAGLSLMVWSRVNPLLSPGKKITIKSELPFAPFLVLGAWLSLIFGLDLLNVATFF